MGNNKQLREQWKLLIATAVPTLAGGLLFLSVGIKPDMPIDFSSFNIIVGLIFISIAVLLLVSTLFVSIQFFRHFFSGLEKLLKNLWTSLILVSLAGIIKAWIQGMNAIKLQEEKHIPQNALFVNTYSWVVPICICIFFFSYVFFQALRPLSRDLKHKNNRAFKIKTCLNWSIAVGLFSAIFISCQYLAGRQLIPETIFTGVVELTGILTLIVGTILFHREFNLKRSFVQYSKEHFPVRKNPRTVDLLPPSSP